MNQGIKRLICDDRILLQQKNIVLTEQQEKKVKEMAEELKQSNEKE